MAFQTGHRRGPVWDDLQTLNKIIHNTCFNLTGKSEHEFELAFMSSVNANADRINGQTISLVEKDTTVRSVYFFSKKHRPDLTINDDGIAIEIKYLSGSLDGLKQAVGQSIFCRVRYRFEMNVFVVAEKYKDLEQIFQDLRIDMNIFSYIVPAFSPEPNKHQALLDWNDIEG